MSEPMQADPPFFTMETLKSFLCILGFIHILTFASSILSAAIGPDDASSLKQGSRECDDVDDRRYGGSPIEERP